MQACGDDRNGAFRALREGLNLHVHSFGSSLSALANLGVHLARPLPARTALRAPLRASLKHLICHRRGLRLSGYLPSGGQISSGPGTGFSSLLKRLGLFRFHHPRHARNGRGLSDARHHLRALAHRTRFGAFSRSALARRSDSHTDCSSNSFTHKRCPQHATLRSPHDSPLHRLNLHSLDIREGETKGSKKVKGKRQKVKKKSASFILHFYPFPFTFYLL